MQDTSKPNIPITNTSRRTGVGSTIGILLLAPLIAVFLTAFVFQSYQVSGQSMEPTLHNDDRLVIWKLARTWSRITGNAYVPSRGDVVIVKTTELAKAGLNPNEQIIKRVIGLPGDRVVVKDNALTVYNTSYPNGFQPEKTLPYGEAIQGTNNNGEWVVGRNELFVCGDNRYNSADSRIFGPVSTNDVLGKLVIRVLPAQDAKTF